MRFNIQGDFYAALSGCRQYHILGGVFDHDKQVARFAMQHILSVLLINSVFSC